METAVAIEEAFVLDVLGNHATAAERLRQSVEVAGRSRQPELIGRAAAKLLVVVGKKLQKPAVALQYAGLARGLAHDAEAEATVLNSVGQVLFAQGKHSESEAEHRAALELRKRAFGAQDASLSAVP